MRLQQKLESRLALEDKTLKAGEDKTCSDICVAERQMLSLPVSGLDRFQRPHHLLESVWPLMFRTVSDLPGRNQTLDPKELPVSNSLSRKL